MPARPTRLVWHVYLLIDPTTEPTNHSMGTVFYVGLHESLPDPGDLRDLLAPEALPEEEVEARERLRHLLEAGERPLVEVIEGSWPGQPRGSAGRGAQAAVEIVCAALTPRPLNRAPLSVERLPGSFVQTIMGARQVRLPEDGAILSPLKKLAGRDYLAMGDEGLFRKYVETNVSGMQSSAAFARVREEPMPLLLIARRGTDPSLFTDGFVLGVWLVEQIVPVVGSLELRRVVLSEDQETLGALRRRYLHQIVAPDDTRGISLALVSGS